MEFSTTLICLGSFLITIFRQTSGSQYSLFHVDVATWEEARDICVAKGLVLAKVDTSPKQTRVEKYGPFMDDDGHFWIGLRAKNANYGRDFTWIDETSLDFTKWADGHPSVSVGVECVRMMAVNFTWETFNCTEKLNFLCENKYYKDSDTVSEYTRVKGIFMGLGVIGGLLLLACLLLQLPCCRYNVTDKIAHIGFGTSDIDKKSLFS